MRRVFLFVFLAMFIPEATGAATIYLRDKSVIKQARIVGETSASFQVTVENRNYSFVYKSDMIAKRDIFCIIDDAGALRYPESLEAFADLTAGAVDSLAAEDFQAALSRQQLEIQKEQNSNLRGLGTVAIISALAAVSSSIALWCIYGQTQ